MSNELAEEITKTIGLMYHKGHTKNEEVVAAVAAILASHRDAPTCNGCGHLLSEHGKFGCQWGCACGACEKDPQAERGAYGPPHRDGELAKALENIISLTQNQRATIDNIDEVPTMSSQICQAIVSECLDNLAKSIADVARAALAATHDGAGVT
jgi:hypothetical protein